MNSKTNLKGLEQDLMKLYSQKLKVNAFSFWMLMIGFVLVSFFALFLMDYITDFPMILRITLSIVVLFLFFFYFPKKRRKSLVKDKNILEITREVEAKASKSDEGFHSILISAMEFSNNSEIGGSANLKSNVIDDAAKPQNRSMKLKLYSRKNLKQMFHLMSAALGVYILWVIIGHHSMGTFFKRAIGLNAFYLTNTIIVNIDAPEYVAQYEDFPVEITLSGKKPTSGLLEVSLDNGENFDVKLIPDNKDKSKYVAIVKQVENSFTFRIVLGDAYRQQRYLKVISSPIVKTAKIKITPPKYTKYPSRVEKLGPLQVLEGSKVNFDITPNRPVEKCFLLYNEKELEMKKTSNGFSYPFDAFDDGSNRYSIKLVDSHGISNNKRIEFPLSVIIDKPASLELRNPVEGGYYAPVSKLNWDLSLFDDYGLTELIMRYSISQRDKKSELVTLKKGSIVLHKFANEKEVNLKGVIKLKQFNLEPGQIFNIEFVVKDNKPGRKEQEYGSTGFMEMNIITPVELRKMIQSEMSGLNNIIKDVQTDMKVQKKKLKIFLNNGAKK